MSPLDDKTQSRVESPNQGLTYDSLKQELVNLFSEDSRLAPLLELLDANEAPNVDYYSDEVEDIIHRLHKLHEDHGVSLPRKQYKVVPFTPKADNLLDRAGDKLEEILGRPSKSFFVDGDMSVQQVIGEEDFDNWGRTVGFEASHTLVVRTVEGVCKVVKWAASEGRKVRVAGFRHSWSEIFGADGDVIIMFLPYDTLVDTPYRSPPADWQTELSGITHVPKVAGRTAPRGHGYYKIMAGTTNDQFRQWCFDNKKVCLPMSVIMVEVTFGGTNAPICHGSGLKTSTLSDIVVEVEYVDAKGVLRTVNDPAELRAASGAFGLLGVVVSLTLQLDDMGVVNMMPVKLPMPLAIPPPKGYTLPHEVQKIMEKYKITEEQLEEAQEEFERRCNDDYYLEWFWFPYQEHCWVNTWKKRPVTADDVDVKAYPGDGLLDGVKSQQVQGALVEALVHYSPFRFLPGRLQAFLFGVSAMLGLPSITHPKDAIKTFQSEAMHFRRGIQNFRCLDSEWEIPIPKVHRKPKFEVIQRAWWDGISAMYSREDTPVRVALEMRLTGGSNVLLAPQRGNDYTCSIEVLTTLITDKDDWRSFMQQIADRWTGYDLRDEHGNVMYPRPHWAKQWAGIRVHGKPVERYLKEDAYKGAFEEFREVFKGIVERNESTVEDTLKVFGNDLMERLIFY